MKKFGLTLAAISLLLSSCGSFGKGFNEGFTKSWHESFIKSCSGDNAPPEQVQACTCMADKALKELTVKQLMDVKYATEWVKNTAAPACMPE